MKSLLEKRCIVFSIVHLFTISVDKLFHTLNYNSADYYPCYYEQLQEKLVKAVQCVTNEEHP